MSARKRLRVNMLKLNAFAAHMATDKRRYNAISLTVARQGRLWSHKRQPNVWWRVCFSSLLLAEACPTMNHLTSLLCRGKGMLRLKRLSDSYIVVVFHCSACLTSAICCTWTIAPVSLPGTSPPSLLYGCGCWD